MRFLFLGLLCCALTSLLQAQDGLQPKLDISPYIAKVPEQSDFLGSWARGDGGYRIEVTRGKAEGSVIVKYFNPKPINVEGATFEVVDGLPQLNFILRDEGYPGSAYQLQFLAERAVLYGKYIRPGTEGDEVYFVNENE